MAAAALAVGLATSPARAAGFWNLERGPSNYGRGGANIADPDDPIALFTNPAGLAGLRGLQLHVDANMLWDDKAFQRAPQQFETALGTYDYTYDRVINTMPEFPPSPGFFVAYNFGGLGLSGLTVALGGYGPPRSDTVFPSVEEGCAGSVPERPVTCTAPQRYSMVESHNLQIHYALGLAYELPWYKLRVGLNFMLIDQVIDTSLVLNADLFAPELPSGFSRPENPGWDVGVHAQAKASGIPNAAFGISGAPVEWLNIGMSFQLPYKANAKGTAELTIGEEMAALTEVRGEDVRVRLRLPPVFRAAVQFDDPAGLFDVELAFVWEGWSVNREIFFTPKGIEVETITGDIIEIPRVTLHNEWNDAYSLRLGGEVTIFPDWWLVRAGGYYEKSPVPRERLSPGSFDLDKVGLTLGSRVDFPLGFWVDLAVGLVLWQTVTVEDTDIVLTHALFGDELHPIANGTYSNTAVYLMAAAGVQIDI